jgi:hypothetical protein
MKKFIAVIGLYDEVTTEQIALKEIIVTATDIYQAHKEALYKCNLQENQLVLRLYYTDNRRLGFDFQKGFLP